MELYQLLISREISENVANGLSNKNRYTMLVCFQLSCFIFILSYGIVRARTHIFMHTHMYKGEVPMQNLL